MAKAANVTKIDAGTIVDNGYIKTVEKVWIDTYTFAAAIASDTSIDLAYVPANKIILGVDLYFPALSTGASGTGTTISIGYRAKTASTTGGSTFLSAGEAAAGILKLSSNAGAGTLTSAESTIYLGIGRIATTTTAGTITSVVHYA